MKKRILMLLLIAMLGLMFVGPAMAQAGGEQAGTTSPNWWHAGLLAFAMAIASAVCGIGQSKAIAAACESVSRNPGAADSIRFFLILGLVLIESLALYTLLVVFLVR